MHDRRQFLTAGGLLLGGLTLGAATLGGATSAVAVVNAEDQWTDRMIASGERLDVYTRSLVEHSTEATEHDIAWLDRLIETEKQKQAAPAADQIGARTVGSAATPGKGTES